MRGAKDMSKSLKLHLWYIAQKGQKGEGNFDHCLNNQNDILKLMKQDNRFK